jgi:mycoredoxin
MTTEPTAATPPAPTQITMYGADWCRDCRRSEALLTELKVDWRKVDVEASAEAAAEAQAISGRMNIPVVAFPDGTHLVEPSDADLTAKLRELGAISG